MDMRSQKKLEKIKSKSKHIKMEWFEATNVIECSLHWAENKYIHFEYGIWIRGMVPLALRYKYGQHEWIEQTNANENKAQIEWMLFGRYICCKMEGAVCYRRMNGCQKSNKFRLESIRNCKRRTEFAHMFWNHN